MRYVLEGSVQRDQNHAYASTSSSLTAKPARISGADRFPGRRRQGDLFKLQDDVVARLTNSLGNELVKAEARGDRRITNLDAFDLTMRGRALSFETTRRATRENNNAARALFEQALAINPEDAGALAGDARTYMIDKVYDWTSTDVDYDAKIVGQADHSIAIDPNDPVPYYVKSLYLSLVLHRQKKGCEPPTPASLWDPRLRVPLLRKWYVGKIQAGMFAEGKSDVLHAIQLQSSGSGLGSLAIRIGLIRHRSWTFRRCDR